jgi:lipopolysaccharide/colanic/teichoic acid biosynthesis glycosyltransferase
MGFNGRHGAVLPGGSTPHRQDERGAMHTSGSTGEPTAHAEVRGGGGAARSATLMNEATGTEIAADVTTSDLDVADAADAEAPAIVTLVESYRWRARRTPAAAAKRGVDVVLGALLSLTALPLIGLLAVIGAVHFRAFPFFTQTRLGHGGDEFTILKLRSLPADTRPYALKSAIGELELSWFSRLLRTTKLDELPQLLQVVTGQLSLIGPRPKMPDHFEPVTPEYQHTRTRVRQGCSCIWQVGVATSGLPNESPQFDYFYLLHGGLRLDAWVMWRTLLTVLCVARPIDLDDVPQWVRGKGWLEQDEAADTLV